MSKFLKTILIDGCGGPYKSFNSDYHLVGENTKVIIVGTITSPQGRGPNKNFYYLSPYNPMYRILMHTLMQLVNHLTLLKTRKRAISL